MAAVVAAARANRLRVTAGINSRTEFRRGIGFRFHEFRRFHRFPVFAGFFGSPFCGPFLGGGFFAEDFLFADQFNCFGGGFFGPSAFFYSNYSTWRGPALGVTGQQAGTDSGDGELPPMLADIVAGNSSEAGPGWIGVSCERLDGIPGLKVKAVLLEGPAAQAGLRAGDIITELEGTPVESAQAFEAEIARRAPGSQIHIHFVHLGWEIEATVTVGESPKSPVR
jgi:membrane-associated protease RseP (regulator of RpoE activity)